MKNKTQPTNKKIVFGKDYFYGGKEELIKLVKGEKVVEPKWNKPTNKKIEPINIYEYPQDYTPVINHDKFGNTYVNKPPLNVILMDKLNEVIDRINKQNETK